MLTDIRLRSSARVELQPLSGLGEEQRTLLRDLDSDPDLVALLVPKPPLTTNVKAVTRRTADLFQSCAIACRLDAETFGDDESIATIVDLILDGIFEIESGDGFISGADALPVLATVSAASIPATRIALLSHEALLHAQDLRTRDPEALMRALYHYNRMPVTPFWKSRFASCDSVLEHLGVRGSLRTLLDQHWSAPAVLPAFVAWPSRVPEDLYRPAVKLYVSPRPERIRDAFEIAVRVLAEFPRSAFKIGNDAAGLLRPDKFVAYFTAREELEEAAAALRKQLFGCEAHGVPFTAAIDEEGLLSWGADPPDSERALQWTARHSWRSWVTSRLAQALSVAKDARRENATEPWRFAIERLRREGIDVENWTPSAGLWSPS